MPIIEAILLSAIASVQAYILHRIDRFEVRLDSYATKQAALESHLPKRKSDRNSLGLD